MPRYFDIRSTVLIVVGYGILPEEEDRPGAFDLKREIVSRGLGAESRGAVVVTDMWMVNQEMAELFPAISLDACESCRQYVKSIDLDLERGAIPEVDDLASLPMDLWAIQEGYGRIEPGWSGI